MSRVYIRSSGFGSLISSSCARSTAKPEGLNLKLSIALWSEALGTGCLGVEEREARVIYVFLLHSQKAKSIKIHGSGSSTVGTRLRMHL